MMRLAHIPKFLVFVLLCGFILQLNGTLAQTSGSQSLPNDIVFTIGMGRDRPPYRPPITNTLVLVSADTLEPMEFYTDEAAYAVRAISWSPQGDRLAVWAWYDAGNFVTTTTLCIITMADEYQICFEDAPDLALPQQPAYPVTWSKDGQKIYLVAGEGERLSLVERDVVSGTTLRTLYQYRAANRYYEPTTLAWTPDLRYIVTNIGDSYPQESGTLINLETGEKQDLSKIVVPWSGGIPQDAPPHAGYVCGAFSPQGTYLTAIDYSDWQHGDRVIVFDMDLQIIASITEFNEPKSPMSLDNCPVWSTSEDHLYIYARSEADQSRHIFVYSMTNRQIVSHRQSDIYPPLFPSPDETHIAFTGFTDGYQVNILYPDGQIRQVSDQFDYSDYPLWRPSQQ